MPRGYFMKLSDPVQVQDLVRPNEVHVVVTGRGRFEAEVSQIKVESLCIERGHISLPIVVHSRVFTNRRMFFLNSNPDQTPILHSGVEVSPSEIVCYPLSSEHHYRTSASFHAGTISLAQDRFAAYEKVLLGHQQPAPMAMRVIRPQPALASRLRELYDGVGTIAATAPDVLRHPEVGRAMEQAFARTMISCLGDAGAEGVHRPSQRRLSVMARFEEMIQTHLDKPLYVTDICMATGVGERMLRLHCQEQLGMSPHRYLWLRRMNLVRHALAHTEPGAKTVTEIANDHGFAELGRFAVRYRRLFGESPSSTLRCSS